MRILHVINIGAIGGAEKLLLQLLPALSHKGSIECLVLYKKTTPGPALEIISGLVDQHIVVQTISYSHLFALSNLKKISGVVNSGNYDLIHSHLKYADSWLSWLKFIGRIKLPVVTTIHSFHDRYERKHGIVFTRHIYLSYYYWLTRFIYRNFQGFIVISNILSKFSNEARLIDKKMQVVIYHGYVKSDLPRARSPFCSNVVAIAVPGRLLERKGQHFAIDALQYIKIPQKRIELHIYGDGPARHKLERQISEKGLTDRVFLHGYVSNLVEKLQHADVVVIPSLWEGFGLVFLDAFAAKTPVVTFDLPASNEIVIDGFSGLVARPGNSESLAEKVTTFLLDPSFRSKIVKNASAELDEKFSMERMTNGYFDFYGKVMKESRLPEIQSIT